MIVREDEPGDQRLVAYVVARVGNTFEPDAARAVLKAALPGYMVPAEFVVSGRDALDAEREGQPRGASGADSADLGGIASAA